MQIFFHNFIILILLTCTKHFCAVLSVIYRSYIFTKALISWLWDVFFYFINASACVDFTFMELLHIKQEHLLVD